MTEFKVCSCKRFRHGEPWKPGDCRACWIAAGNRDELTGTVNTAEEPVKLQIRNPACIYLEQSKVFDRRGKACVHEWILGCEVHGKCTTGVGFNALKSCRSCNEYVNPNAEEETIPKTNPISFDRVVLINLKRRPDRLESFRTRQEAMGWKLPDPVIFEAIDGNRVGMPYSYQAGGGGWGCLRSHVSILERAAMDGVQSLLVLEDDLTWHSSSWDRLNRFLGSAPKDWDVLMLGGQHIETPIKISNEVDQCVNCQRTHAYAIRGEVIPDLLRLWNSCNTHIDHRMGPWGFKKKTYAPSTFVFGQSAGESDISGNRNPDKFWISPADDFPMIHLTAPKKVMDVLRGRGFHNGFDRNNETGIDNGLNSAVEIVPAMRRMFIQKWIDAVTSECASSENMTPTMWHPKISANELRSFYSGTVIEISGETIEECLKQIPKEIKLRKNYADNYVVHLTADRSVAEAIRGNGFHIGYWRCSNSGHDNGLRNIALLPDKTYALKEWIKILSNEALSIENGIATVWHPSITVDDVKKAADDRKVIVLKGSSTKQIYEQFKGSI